MNLVLFCHPDFMASQSMPRFAAMLKSAYERRGHSVAVWSPSDDVHKRLRGTRLEKWAGYVDQYLVFPWRARRRLRAVPTDTLFVFCDQALGPWVPLIRGRPHVVHVHDLLALRSALGEFPENPTRFTGRLYQRYIRWGFRHARHFISVSRKTRADLQRFGRIDPVSSEVVYNGLTFDYRPMPTTEAIAALRNAGLTESPQGMLLHVGGNQWYKNQRGVVALYARYAAQLPNPLPLWCISPPPNAELTAALRQLPPAGRVSFLQGIDNPTLRAAYSYASALLFPSLEEGFGWPLIEAQACGCAVITTDEPPMNEVAGDAAVYLPRQRFDEAIDTWAVAGASALRGLLEESDVDRQSRRQRGLAWAKRFEGDKAIDAYLSIYQKVLNAAPAEP